MHRIASHCIALHRIASLCITLHRIAPHCIALHRIASHCIALHRIASHYITHLIAHIITHLITHLISGHVCIGLILYLRPHDKIKIFTRPQAVATALRAAAPATTCSSAALCWAQGKGRSAGSSLLLSLLFPTALTLTSSLSSDDALLRDVCFVPPFSAHLFM